MQQPERGDVMMQEQDAQRQAISEREVTELEQQCRSEEQSATSKRRLWNTDELRTIAELVEVHKTPQGRVSWTKVAQEWHDRAMPERTPAAMKAAYAKLAKRAKWAARQPRMPAKSSQQPGAELAVRKHIEEPTPSTERGRRERIEKDFKRVLRKALIIKERRPIQRPKRIIPKALMQVGNEILARHFARAKRIEKTMKGTNAATYAMGMAIMKETRREEHKEKEKELDRRIEETKELKSTIIRIVSTLEREILREEQPQQGGCTQPSKKFKELAEIFSLDDGASVRTLSRQLKDEYTIVIAELEQLVKRKQWKQALGAGRRSKEGRSDIELPIENIHDFWKEIVGQPRMISIGEELEEWARSVKAPGGMSTTVRMEATDWKELFAKIRPWKAAGPDGIQAYWWKSMKVVRRRLETWCTRALKRRRQVIPQWLCRGRVVLIPKKGKDSKEPGDYRPITCLNTCYKVLTGMIARLMMKEVEGRLAPEQLALKKGLNGCMHAHILDQTTVRDAQRRGKELHMLWIDMAKAYDSVAHKSLRWILKRWKISPQILGLLARIMKNQKVRYYGKYQGEAVKSDVLAIKNGLLQGDALSPLLFVLAITPISHWIHENVRPYEVTVRGSSEESLRVGHIFYMDDLKVYTCDWNELAKAKKGIENVAKQIGLQINIRKSAIKSMNHKQGSVGRVKEIGQIPMLGSTNQYRYLGVEQNALMNIGQLWTRTEEACIEKVQDILSSEITAGQKIMEYNTEVLPKIRYAVSCIIFGEGRFNSLRKRANELDTRLRAIMIENKMRFRGSCRARLYVSVQNGGLGIKAIEEEVEHSVIYTWCYLAMTKELEVAYELTKKLEARGKRSISSDFHAIMRDRGLEEQVMYTAEKALKIQDKEYQRARDAARTLVNLVHKRWQEMYLKEWKEREVASRVIRPFRSEVGVERGQLSIRDPFIWMNKGKIAAETMRNIIAVQEAALRTRGSQAGKCARRNVREEFCRMNCESRETAEHIVSGCDHWRGNLMRERHDNVAKVIYRMIKEKYGMSKRYKDETNEIEVIEDKRVVIYWNVPIVTREYVRCNKPDIVVWEREEKKIWIIEIAVAWYTRIGVQEESKLMKYGVNGMLPQNIAIQDYTHGVNLKEVLERERECEVEIIPIVIGCCGECTKKLRTNVDRLQLVERTDRILEKIQRAAINGTNRIVKCHLLNGE